MSSKVFLAIRIIFGVFLIVFGSNKFLQFMPAGEIPETAMNYLGALMSTKTFTLVALVEILSGLSLIFNKFGALMMLILMGVSVNALLFHLYLSWETLPPALFMFVLNLVMLYGYRDKYQPLLKG